MLTAGSRVTLSRLFQYSGNILRFNRTEEIEMSSAVLKKSSQQRVGMAIRILTAGRRVTPGSSLLIAVIFYHVLTELKK